MDKVIKIGYPASLVLSLKLDVKAFKSEIKTSSLVKLYELGKVSSGTAASVLGISRIDFLDVLSEYKVSMLDTEELDEDIKNA